MSVALEGDDESPMHKYVSSLSSPALSSLTVLPMVVLTIIGMYVLPISSIAKALEKQMAAAFRHYDDASAMVHSYSIIQPMPQGH